MVMQIDVKTGKNVLPKLPAGSFKHNEKKLTNGKRPLDFEAACKRFHQRFTMQHTPPWAKQVCERSGRYPAPYYHNDQEWYKNTEFIGFDSTSARKYCRSSNPSWPVGRWLDKPFDIKNFDKEAKAERRQKKYPAKPNSKKAKAETESGKLGSPIKRKHLKK